MATKIAPSPNSCGLSSVRRQLARRKCFVVASLHHQNPRKQVVLTNENAFAGILDRRQSLIGMASVVTALNLGAIAPGPALAKSAEKKEPTIINDPSTLKTQLEAQYQQWSSGQFDTWLATQPETMKWQSSYNGTLVKLKGKAGAKQYFTMLNADLDIQSYKPLAIFVDNDGDEATVVVETSGLSRRTKQPFKTFFLHAYTIGPMGQVLKFKETTDTALMSQLIPPPPPATLPDSAATGGAGDYGSGTGGSAPDTVASDMSVQPGATARSA
ncbi:hypothetical protein Vretifemale_5663 [Volvox reticuliferus]|uniref:SnoaL-like domain-containing protein n=1 Tax=Volvox reticuliferus TaxID=1737510 RepID=A0A8J4FKL4_9CHLO|nr:hypothetical protein Vretifemale_5663 [Volvox reticuliferus]